MTEGDSVLSVEYKLSLLAAAPGELLVACGRVLRSGRTLSVSQVEVFAVETGRETLCATMLQTLIRVASRAGMTPG
jgi:acyl-coenzyme A thioesterase PaaI-like protein